MATITKNLYTLDMNGGKKRPYKQRVHYIRIGKGNAKKAAAEIGGELHTHLGDPKKGDFSIKLITRINRRIREVVVGKDDIVFRTGDHNRWQVMTRKGFQKRFPDSGV